MRRAVAGGASGAADAARGREQDGLLRREQPTRSVQALPGAGAARWQARVPLGYFATAEEAALCVARTPEGRKAAKRAASAPPPRRNEEEGQGNPSAMPPGAVLKEEGVVPPMPLGAFVKEEVFPLMPPGAFVKEEVVVKREHEVVADEGGRSDGRPKRRRGT